MPCASIHHALMHDDCSRPMAVAVIITTNRGPCDRRQASIRICVLTLVK